MIRHHEPAMIDSNNRASTLQFSRSANLSMNRDDLVVWLSLVCFVALCGAAIWVLSRPACDVFG
jgi:hypothetical protein